ncbi:BTAD domain-containing putative transcriptional regulator [Streptomyces sp. C]|uniref:AfsR/SARP family transcriptional regulator n=1 Tax=Streptomyces sp. C TaxID=253839 RepID=UPI0001B547B9|nr:BTAD domain-containing putative transcriptional regulator [Streptomyces sp. C]EFL17243.1 SARP family pathway specific regulatory protein [Streptomyces sp. C]
MRLRLLGPFLVVTADGTSHTPGPPKVAQALALLATQPGQVVSSDTLVRELWRENPPRTALATAQTHIHHARRRLDELSAGETSRPVLITCPSGYMLHLEDHQATDVRELEDLVLRADAELGRGDAETAAAHTKRALAIRRGPLVSNIPVGHVLAGRRARLEELYVQALELHIEITVRLGRYREVIPELRLLVHDHPHHEWFHGHLIAALHRCGRRTEALQAYRTLERILDEELGLSPLPSTRRLMDLVLEPNPDGSAAEPPWSVLPRAGRPAATPR